MQVSVIIMFHTAGSSGGDTVHREKCSIDINEDEAERWTRKELVNEVE